MSMPTNWIELKSMEELGQAFTNSADSPILIFKHSVTCGISASAKHKLARENHLLPSKVKFYYLDLLRYRPISNAIADELHVIHQSPQIILYYQGKVLHSSSHHAISVSKINEVLNVLDF